MDINSILKDKNLINDLIYSNSNGFITYTKVLDEIDITYIYIDELKRNQGFGTKMLKSFLNEFKNYKINLEVREDNLYAIKLYKNCGFIKIHIRNNYYGNNVDGIVMQKGD